ncbi:MAG: class I SAM-dependent methyltransferase [Deltaproteobacteria bacterium]|nr:MAG: class I SAM-dependent methyltransferase [Deltaproteobacteria bacterium]
MSDDGKAFWERTAGRYDLSMTLFGGPLQAMLPLVAEEVDGLERVLELAAGTGLVSAAIAPVVGELVATDYAEAMVAKLEGRVRSLGLDNVRTRTLDVYALDGEEQFDAIVAANVLHLLPDLDGALNAMIRALKPGGRLIVPTYCHDQSALARVTSRVLGLVGFPGQRRLTLDRLLAALIDRGLKERRSQLLDGLLPIGFVSVERKP